MALRTMLVVSAPARICGMYSQWAIRRVEIGIYFFRTYVDDQK
jgi:hypothetical protein